MTKISRNFEEGEFLVSADYPELAAKMRLSKRDKEHLWPLVHCGLQPIRDYFGIAVIILSGKRSSALNEAVNGAPSSQHLVASAADFIIPTVPMAQVYEYIKHELCWGGQLFFYQRDLFIHLGLPQPGVTKRQFIK